MWWVAKGYPGNSPAQGRSRYRPGRTDGGVQPVPPPAWRLPHYLVCLTRDDMDDRRRYLNARLALTTLLEHKVVIQ